MKEWRGVSRHGDASVELRDEGGRRRGRWESPQEDLEEELSTALGNALSKALSEHLDPDALARLRSKLPGKVTRAERELLRAELGDGAMSPEAAWRYARWLVSDERGWSAGIAADAAQMIDAAPRSALEIGRAGEAIAAVGREALGGLTSAFGFLARVARFEDFRALGLRQLLGAAEAHGGEALRDATRSAAAEAPGRRLVRGSSSDLRPRSGQATSRELAQRGQAMWRAAERRGAMLYRRALDAGEVSDDGPEVAAALQRCGNGQPLPSSVQRTMEAKLGVALGRVRVHTDEVADQAALAVHAEAFTVGEDIFFARGAFAPGTPAGDRLLAHELTHVVQAWQGRSESQRGEEGPRVSRPDEALEREAEEVADRVERGERRVLGDAAPPVEVRAEARAEAHRESGAETQRAETQRAETSREMKRSDAAEAVAGSPASPSSSQASPPTRPSALLSPDPLPLLSPHAQRLLRRAVQPAMPRGSVPRVKGGMGKQPGKDGDLLAAQQEMRGAGGEFTRKARQASERSVEKLGHGLSASRTKPPGKGAKDQAKGDQRKARASEEEARALERRQRAKAEERSNRGAEAGDVPVQKGEKPDTRSPIQLKAIDDWSKFMPAPLPDQDERERARIEKLVKQKIQGERRQAQGALEQLRGAHLKQAREVRAMKPKLQGQIAGAERQALGKVSSAEAAQSGAVRAHVAAMQGQVQAHAAAMKAQVAQAHRAAIQKIDATHKAANDKLTKSKTQALDDVKGAESLALLLCSMDFLNARTRFTALGAKKAGDAITVGEEEAGKMSGQWDGEKLEAAQKAARETADGFASSMTEQAAAALAQIEATRPDAEKGLRDLAKSVREGFEKSYEASKKALDEAQRASKQAADAAAKAAQGQLDQTSSSTVASLGAHGASQVAAIAKQAQGARSGIASAAKAARAGAMKACDQAAAGIEKGVVGLIRGARQIEAPNPEETKQQVQEGAQSLERGAKDVAKGLGKTASDSASGLLQQASSAADGMAQVATAAKGTATQMAAGAKQQMTGVARGAADSLGQLAQAHKTTSDETFKAAETGFKDQVKALRDAYEDAATQRAKQLDDNYNQCASALSQAVPDRGGGRGGGGSGKKGEEGGESGGAAKDEIASIQENAQKAADAVKPWWQKALAVVVSIVVAVVVVIVVTALVVTTGPVGMILVGAAAGALASVAGSMASNLVLGNGLFDGITWKSVLIGAIGGGLGAGLTAGLGAGAGALAQSTRFAGTALGRGAQATATAVQGAGQGFGQFALKAGIETASDLVSEQAANLIVTGKLDITVEGLVLSLVTSAATSHPKFDAFQGAVQSGIQRHTPIRVDVPALQIQIGNPQAPGGGTNAGGGDGGAAGGNNAGGNNAGGNNAGGGTTARPGDGGPQGGRTPDSSTGGDQNPGGGDRSPGGDPASGGRAPGGADPSPGGRTPGGADRDPGGRPDRGDNGGRGDGPPPRDGDSQTGKPEGDKPGRDSDKPDTAKPDDKPGRDGDKPDTAKPDDKPGRDGDKPDTGKPDSDQPGRDGDRPDTAKPDDKPGADKPGADKPGADDKPGRDGDKPDAGKSDGDKPGRDGDGPAADGDTSPDADGPAADPVAARDAELDGLGYPEGTRAKADELASKIEQGELPPKDVLRDTEANQRGVRELKELLSDPSLTPEAKAKLQQDLAARLREQADPTGDLPRDLKDTRERAKNEEGAKKDGDPSTDSDSTKDGDPTKEDGDTSKDSDETAGDDRAKGQVAGGRNGLIDDTMEMLTDPSPTPRMRELQEEAARRHPNDPERQMDFLWKQLPALRREILARRDTDIPQVVEALERFGLTNISPEVAAKVFDYLFNSSGLAFHYPNYQAWSRLASGNGTVADVRFIIHESHEIGLMEQAGVDFMGNGLELNTPAHEAWYRDVFEPAYMNAHRQALRVEYEFLADQVSRVAGDDLHLTPEELAALDPSSDEAREYMQSPDGRDISAHPDFPRWQQRGEEVVTLSPERAAQLGLSSPDIKLKDLISLIRRTRMDNPALRDE